MMRMPLMPPHTHLACDTTSSVVCVYDQFLVIVVHHKRYTNTNNKSLSPVRGPAIRRRRRDERKPFRPSFCVHNEPTTDHRPQKQDQPTTHIHIHIHKRTHENTKDTKTHIRNKKTWVGGRHVWTRLTGRWQMAVSNQILYYRQSMVPYPPKLAAANMKSEKRLSDNVNLMLWIHTRTCVTQPVPFRALSLGLMFWDPGRVEITMTVN